MIVDVGDVTIVDVDVEVCEFEVVGVIVVANISMFVIGVVNNDSGLVGETIVDGMDCNGFGVADGIGDDKIAVSVARRTSISEIGCPRSNNKSRIILISHPEQPHG